ncbi:hypothetical protein NE857_13315 [Nocardiopsis exhalans]|uniref:ATP-binding protein n=1 Tax=Nocardiopsis exhalans TaxID=163604 RepID=A0ABY5DHF4_9ACTN|nr:hypothetical protein [Nocardiopsis exhalans]USY22498.1 hypothetical protein NE857_13315 [Nocardiopsis exhalans]
MTADPMPPPVAGDHPDEAPEQLGEDTPADAPLLQENVHNSRMGTNNGQAVNVNRLDGDINFHERPDYREFLGEAATRRLRHAAGLGTDRIRDVRLTFHPADRHAYEKFVRDLAWHRLGLIIGEPGNGRTHTAVHALTEPELRGVESTDQSLEAVGTGVDEVIIDPDEPDAGLAGITLDSDHPRFLDLSALPAPERSQRAAVRALVEQARSGGSHLVVIAQKGPWEDELLACRARMRADVPAQAEDVFRGAMGRLGQKDSVHLWLRDQRVQQVLASSGPGRAAQFVREAARTRPPQDLPAGEESHTELGWFTEQEHRAWIDRVFKGFAVAGDPLPGWSGTGGRGEQGEAFGEREGKGEQEFTRVLIQTVALLHGATSDTIAEQARRLAERWGVEPPHPTPVSGDGFTRCLETIGAEVSYGHVGFVRKEHWWAALDHLWCEYPGARASFQEWGHGAAAALPKRERVAVARRWLRLARHHRDPAPVSALLDHWGNDRLLWAAAPVVAEAAVCPEIGGAVRSHLYRIVTSAQPAWRYLLALEACRVYGRVQPRTALTRLRHLAGRIPEKWTENLSQALLDIAVQPHNFPVLLEVLLDWLDQEGRSQEVAARSLMTLLNGEAGLDFPELLEKREAPATPLALVWCGIARALPEAREPLWDWISALDRLRGQGRGGVVLDCLCTAAGMDPPFGELLDSVARRWSVSHTRLSPAVEDLRRFVRIALEPTGRQGDHR